MFIYIKYISFFLVSFCYGEDGAQNQVAQVVTTSGNTVAYVYLNHQRKLAPNSPIYEGEIVKTEKGSSVKLLFKDDSIMDLGPDSKFKVDEFKMQETESRKGLFSLAYGTVRALVAKPVGNKGSYKMKTRDAVMGVRGTQFVVSAPNVATGSGVPTNIIVASGSVAVVTAGSAAAAGDFNSGSAPKGGESAPTMVSAGQSISMSRESSGASSGGSSGATISPASQPQTMAAGQMQAVVQSSTVQDNSFRNAISVDGNKSEKTADKAADKAASSESAPAAKGQNMTMTSLSNVAAAVVGSNEVKSFMNGVTTFETAPTSAVRMDSVMLAPPVNILPGSMRTITVIVQ